MMIYAPKIRTFNIPKHIWYSQSIKLSYRVNDGTRMCTAYIRLAHLQVICLQN